MLEIHLKQPGFTYRACGPLTKNKERIQEFKETGDARYIYRNELDQACFQHDLAYGDFEYLARRTASVKVLTDKAFNIAKNPKYDGGFSSMVYKFFDKRTSAASANKFAGSGTAMLRNEQLAKELHQPIIKNF